MEKSRKRHPTEIRFSPFSLLCLFFVWVGVSALAFYVGILVGRMEQMREIRSAYEADENVVAEEEFPPLSFEESLSAPDEEGGEERPSPVPTTRLPEPLSQPLAESGSTGSKVLQVASFREPDRADHLVQALRQKGYPCFQRRPSSSEEGGGYCRVYVGPLPNAEMAVKVKEHLEQREGFEHILIRSGVKREEPF